MGYVFLAIALFAGITKGYCGKTISRSMETFRECIFINLMRMLFCTVVGFLLALVRCGFSDFAVSFSEVKIYIFAGACMMTFCAAWMYAYRNEAYMFLSIFTMLGTIVTCLLDYLIYKAPIHVSQWIGMALLLLSVFIMANYNKVIKGKLTGRGLLLLIIGSTGAALADFSQKIFVREIGKKAEIFNFYMYAVGFLLLAVILTLQKTGNEKKIKHIFFEKKSVWIYFCMAFFLYLNSVTKTMAAGFLPSAQIYPVLQGANLILSALMANFIFKEKMNRKGVLGMTIAFLGLLLM
ncbi:MAG: EamA family transporter [Clostridia bacterium]|nr:EamA family transporter [Clostridia bacterium]